VRLRAAEALVGSIRKCSDLEQWCAQDRYGLYAYLAALENADLRVQLETELQATRESAKKTRSVSRMCCKWAGACGRAGYGGSAIKSPAGQDDSIPGYSTTRFFWYYLASNLAYLMMLIVALKTSAAHQRRLESYRFVDRRNNMTPPITIIAPAHTKKFHSRCGAKPSGEPLSTTRIVVVNDGSEIDA